MQKKNSGKAIDIKISTVVAVSAILQHTDVALLDAAMQEMTGGATDFFDDELAVLDVGALDLAHDTLDWPALIALLRTYRLHAVAVRNAPATLEENILAHGLTLDRHIKPRANAGLTDSAGEQSTPAAKPTAAASITTAVPPPVAPPVQQAAPGSMVVDTPVRAGQRIYARGCDLIITAAVNNGAEVIADGSIHIYAPLRGRALAGASGNAEARIFAGLMEAELVSIAGIYRTFDNGYPDGLRRGPVQIRLVGDRLDIHAISS
ncbi:MAG: septum site-determining protein MinC [Pseudomonadota bacterium]|nr:septum site-determining protein MinC [Pseudomonadota bacterium]